MANKDQPKGFGPTPLGHVGRYQFDTSDSTAKFIGDVIQTENDGYNTPATAADAGLIGVNLTYLAASTLGSTTCADDPDQVYVAQDDASATLTVTDRGRYADHVKGTGSASTKLSGHELNATVSDTATGFFLLDLFQGIGNAFGNNADWLCIMHDHQVKRGTSTA